MWLSHCVCVCVGREGYLYIIVVEKRWCGVLSVVESVLAVCEGECGGGLPTCMYPKNMAQSCR